MWRFSRQLFSSRHISNFFSSLIFVGTRINFSGCVWKRENGLFFEKCRLVGKFLYEQEKRVVLWLHLDCRKCFSPSPSLAPFRRTGKFLLARKGHSSGSKSLILSTYFPRGKRESFRFNIYRFFVISHFENFSINSMRYALSEFSFNSSLLGGFY